MEENIDDYQINPNITSYNTLLKKIDDYGPLNKVINDINILQEIISYPDNGLLLALIEKINYALFNNQLNKDDLNIIRSDFLVNSILNLQAITNRKLNYFELATKLNYLTLIKDLNSLQKCFIDSNLIETINENFNNLEYRYFITSGSIYLNLPIVIQNQIAYKFASLKKLDYSKYIIKNISQMQKKYPNYFKEKNKLLKK
ncbi:MAG: hypothetical protein IJ068_07280 [Bacilli bacterium]|nr:hypothetical protein [Bacilli bacterium]